MQGEPAMIKRDWKMIATGFIPSSLVHLESRIQQEKESEII
jgi:hypothetical protein